MKRVRISNDDKAEVVTICDHLSRLRFSRSLRYAVTEHGALMAANVPHSQKEPRTLPLPDNTPNNRSQIVTGFQKHLDPRFLPRAFTEHGALMAAKSPSPKAGRGTLPLPENTPNNQFYELRPLT